MKVSNYLGLHVTLTIAAMLEKSEIMYVRYLDFSAYRYIGPTVQSM